MKRNIKYNIFGWLAASALFLTTACADNADLYMAKGGSNSTNVVTFTIQPQSQSMGTRAGDESETSNPFRISDGSHVDVLVFAVYERARGSNEEYTLATEFQKYNTAVGNVAVGMGQNVIDMTNEQFPYTFQFIADTDKEYKIAFWAQNKGTNAYDAKNLEKVEVKYNKPENNDELRDAFCGVGVIDDNSTTAQTIILRRPLAQINVGTTGWDYEGAAILKPSRVSYAESEITLKGVARFYNVLEGKALAAEDLASIVDAETQTESATTDVTFKYNRLPAFIHLTDDDWNNLNYKTYSNEEFLYVNLDENKNIEKYVNWEGYKNYRENHKEEFEKGGLPSTETFKYLSMCYVLVPEPRKFGEMEVPGATYGSVLSTVTFSTRGPEQEDEAENAGELQPEDGGATTPKEIEFEKVFEIHNVPVQKNWRTNILGNSFFVLNTEYNVYVVPDYCGDYNYIDDEWKNVNFDDSDNNNWKLKGSGNGDVNDDFRDPGEDYYPQSGENDGQTNN